MCIDFEVHPSASMVEALTLHYEAWRLALAMDHGLWTRQWHHFLKPNDIDTQAKEYHLMRAHPIDDRETGDIPQPLDRASLDILQIYHGRNRKAHARSAYEMVERRSSCLFCHVLSVDRRKRGDLCKRSGDFDIHFVRLLGCCVSFLVLLFPRIRCATTELDHEAEVPPFMDDPVALPG